MRLRQPGYKHLQTPTFNKSKFVRRFLNLVHGDPYSNRTLLQQSTTGIWSAYLSPRSFFFPRASERRVLPMVGVCKTSSHPHIFSSSHLLIFASSHLHICLSSHLHIFTSAHLHIFFTSAHLHIFSCSHLHIFSCSHLHIFSSSHLLILTSAHLHTFTSSHLLIFTSSHAHIFTSSHPHIFTSAHLHICSSPHPHIFTSSPLALLPSCPLLLFYFSFEGGGQGQCQRDGTKRNLFARNDVRSPKTEVKLRFQLVPRNSFARNEAKTEVKLQVVPRTLSHEMRFDRQKLK